MTAAVRGDVGGIEASARPGPRRVLVVAPQPFYEDRGTPIAVRQAVEALAVLGYAVDLLTYPVGRDLNLPGVRHIRLPNPLGFTSVPVGLSAKKLFLDGFLYSAVRRCLRAERYVAVHAVEEAAFPVIWLCRSRGIPVLYDMQSSLPEQLAQHCFFRFAPIHSVALAAEKWLLNNASLVVSSTGLAARVRTVSPKTHAREWRYFGQITPTPNEPMRATPRVELGIAANSRVVLYAGTFAGYQGLEGLIAAIPSVKSRVPYAVFVFVGGTSHDELPADVTRLQREGTLRVVPRTSRDELPRYYAAADVLVSPRSYGNNAPLKIFDYLNAGRPIVATDIAAHRALLAEERGLLVEPLPGAIADAIVRVLQDPQLAETLVRNANKYVSEHLGWDGFVKVVAEWYEQIAPRAAES